MFFRFFILSLALPTILFAQEDARRIRIDARRPLRIDYQTPSWNKDPKSIESGAILVRDTLTGRIAKVEVTESGPDTGFFVGQYQLTFQNNEKPEITPEIYLAPSNMIKSDQGLARIESLIKNGTLLRKPYFLRTERKVQTLSVFDSKAQAVESYQNFLNTGIGRPLIDPSVFEADQVAQKQAAEKARLDQESSAQNERAKLEALQDKEIADFEKLSPEEKAARKAQADALNHQAMALYNKLDFKGAVALYEKSFKLYPKQPGTYFPYGVTLAQVGKNQEAILALRKANDPSVDPLQRDYYLAFSHMALKENETAHKLLTDIKNKNDKNLSGNAAFYAGIIDFQAERYEKAKENFEFTLDNSTDPKIDQQAETYIEQIQNIMKFEEIRKKKWILSANLGLTYDSNILNVANGANSPTDLAGYRWSYGGAVEYRPVYSQKEEFSVILALSDLYSTDKSFKGLAAFQNTDPLTLNISAPYKWKGIALGKPAQLGVTPAFETIRVNADGSAPRETIVSSYITKGDGTFVMNENHFSTYGLEVRRDVSMTSVPGSDDDLTANKVTLSTAQTVFQDPKKTKALIYDGALASNMAVGKNQKFNRLDLGVSYMMPGPWESSFIPKLSYGYANYPNHSVGRTDSAYGMTLILAKPLSETLNATFMANYTSNNSTLAANAYNKYSIISGLAWKKAF